MERKDGYSNCSDIRRRRNKWCKQVVDFIIIHISAFLSFAITVCYMIFNYKQIVDLYSSKNITIALESVLTFTSIIIGLMSLLLTTIISQKEDSELVKYFLNVADKKVLKRTILYNVASGIVCAFISIVLLLSDTIAHIGSYLFYAWLWVLIYFFASTLSFVNILVSLLLGNKRTKLTMNTELDPSKVEELDNAIELQPSDTEL